MTFRSTFMRTGSSRKIIATLAILVGCTAFSATSASRPTAKIDAALIGDWEVRRVLMNGPNAQWSMREDDPRLMARTLRITADTVDFAGKRNCALMPMVGGQNVSMRALFAKENGVKRPSQMKETLYERLRNYEIGTLRAEPKFGYSQMPHPVDRIGNVELSKLSGRAVKLLQTRCADRDGTFFSGFNWIAVVPGAPPDAQTTTLLLPYQPDALMVLRRAPSAPIPGPEQAEFCKSAVTPSDRAICTDRQLWLLHAYTLSAQKFATSRVPAVQADIDAGIAASLQKRAACSGDTKCLFDVLDDHIDTLVQRW
jgi:hypothetical protein